MISIICYFNFELYFFKMFISFLIFHFIFNKFKYSDNKYINLLQRFVVYYICVFCCFYLFTYLEIFDTIHCDSDDKGSGDESNENSEAYEHMIKLQKELDTLTNILLDSDITNQYIPHISKLYEYLDSISLFQEIALLHIIIFIVLLLTVFNILSVLFGNEIIRYFDLEARFPKLGFFFKLRSSLQKYYLVWNVFILFIVCIASIGLNLLIFVVK